MKNTFLKKLYSFICIAAALLLIAPILTASAKETKEDIYREHDYLDPFTDPDKFVEKFGLNAEGDFDPANYDYFFYDLDTRINVSEDNRLEVTEFIDVYFKDSIQPITRVLPLFNQTAAANDTHYMNNVKISGIYSDSPITYKEKGDSLIVTLGSGLSGRGFKQFRLHYTYDLGTDPLKGCDELYFNILGLGLDRPVLRCQAEINMPKQFDTDKVSFFSTGYAGGENELVTYSYDGLSVKAETTYHIDAGRVLACRITLPEGYFDKAGRLYDIPSLIALAATTLMVLICGYIVMLSRKRSRLKLTFEYYPPKELDPCEAVFLKTGRATNKGIAALIMHLANRGYIGVKELSKGAGVRTRQTCGFFYTLRKSTAGLKPDEKLFIKGMFGSRTPKPDSEEEISVADETLRFSFYKTADEIREHIENDKSSVCRSFFINGGVHIRLIYMIVMVLLSCIGIALPLSITGTGSFAKIDLFALIAASAAVAAFLILTSMLGRIVKYAASFLTLVIAAASLESSGTTVFAWRIALYTGLIASLAVNIFYDHIGKIRTPYGQKLYCRLVSFERFLRSADAGKLTKLVDADPDYYTKLLPYTYALEVSIPRTTALDKLYLKTPPEWYDYPEETGSFGYYSLSYLLDAATSDLTYRPSDAVDTDLVGKILGGK